VVALLANESECLPDADCETLSEDPSVWLDAMAELIQEKHPERQVVQLFSIALRQNFPEQVLRNPLTLKRI
jgi:hypothetical protein